MSAALCRERLERFAEPILVLEMRKMLRHRSWPMAGVFAFFVLGLPLALLLQRPAPGDIDHVLPGGVCLSMLLIFLLAPAQGFRSISRERESGTWDVLAVTPMPSSRIADQKILAAAMPVLLSLASGLPMAATLVALHAASPLKTLALAVVLVLAAIEVSSMSVFASSELAKSALIFSYLPAVLCLSVFSLLVLAAVRHTSSLSSGLIDAQRTGAIIGLLLGVPLAIGIRLLQARRFPVTGLWQKAQLGCMALLWLLFVIWPWFRDQVSYAMPRCMRLFILCITPAGSMQELVGNGASSLPVLGPACLPAYGITATTVVLQLGAIALLRNSAVRRIERLRRAE